MQTAYVVFKFAGMMYNYVKVRKVRNDTKFTAVCYGIGYVCAASADASTNRNASSCVILCKEDTFWPLKKTP